MAILRRRYMRHPKYENSVFTPRQAFTLKVFHGGELVIRSGQARYVRGKCQYFDWVSLAEMDVSRLYKFATELGYENPGALDYYYKPDNCGGHGFFKEIFGPPDIIKMSTDLDIFRIGVLYMLERPKDDIEDDDDQLQNNRNVEPPTVITISDDAMESEGECEWNESASSGIGCRGGRSTAEHVMSVVGENIICDKQVDSIREDEGTSKYRNFTLKKRGDGGAEIPLKYRLRKKKA